MEASHALAVLCEGYSGIEGYAFVDFGGQIVSYSVLESGDGKSLEVVFVELCLSSFAFELSYNFCIWYFDFAF